MVGTPRPGPDEAAIYLVNDSIITQAPAKNSRQCRYMAVSNQLPIQSTVIK